MTLKENHVIVVPGLYMGHHFIVSIVGGMLDNSDNEPQNKIFVQSLLKFDRNFHLHLSIHDLI